MKSLFLLLFVCLAILALFASMLIFDFSAISFLLCLVIIVAVVGIGKCVVGPSPDDMP